MEFCKKGEQCTACPLQNQPEDVIAAVGGAVERAMQKELILRGDFGGMLIWARHALQDVGIARPAPAQSHAVAHAIKRIAVNGECEKYSVSDKQ